MDVSPVGVNDGRVYGLYNPSEWEKFQKPSEFKILFGKVCVDCYSVSRRAEQ